jgi:hypothetical protein
MVTDCVIVTGPKSPGSSASISPLEAVLARAPENVRPGAVRLSGFESSPTPETHVRVACPKQFPAKSKTPNTGTQNFLNVMGAFLSFRPGPVEQNRGKSTKSQAPLFVDFALFALKFRKNH